MVKRGSLNINKGTIKMTSLIVITAVLVQALFICSGDSYSWARWSRCTKSCGTGSKTRTRYCGSGCSEHETVPCKKRNCGGAPSYTWSAWSKCDKSCGYGRKKRTFDCGIGCSQWESDYCKIKSCRTRTSAGTSNKRRRVSRNQGNRESVNPSTKRKPATNSNKLPSKGITNQGLSPSEIKSCVASTNYYRGLHSNTPGLEWDKQLADKALRWATKLLKKSRWLRSGAMIHSSDRTYGENIYWSAGSAKSDCSIANKEWYKEIKNYNYATHRSNGGVIGHFTQLVWKGTTKFGIGVVTGKHVMFKNAIQTFVVANYYPAGNMGGEYSANVMPLK